MTGGPATDVVVVGGGPAGVGAAVFLRQQGYAVTLLDEARFPRDKVCGEGISPESWRLLRRMGAAEVVRALGPRPLRGMRLRSPDGTVFTGEYTSADAGLAVRRQDLDAALLAVARQAGVTVREGVRAAGLLRRDGVVQGVTAIDGAGPETVTARVVVGADGRRSMVARALGLLVHHSRLRKFAVRGHWRGVEGLGDFGEMHVAPGAYCGIAPLGAREANVTFVVDRREMAAAAGDLDHFYHRALVRWPEVRERLARAELLGPPRAIGPLALVARRASAPGAVLVGDAAGFYDPFTGEGVTLALRGAEIASEVVGAVLRAGGHDFSEYDRRRRLATRDKFRLNRLLQAVIARPWAADAVARRLARRPDLARRLVGIAGDFVPARRAFSPRFLFDLLTA